MKSKCESYEQKKCVESPEGGLKRTPERLPCNTAENSAGFLALTVVSSWQQEITEKSLTQMLDQLIEDTGLTSFSNENENNSRIIYIKQDNFTRPSHDARLNTVHSGEYENLEDLVNKIDNSKQNINVNSEAEHDITVHRTFLINDGDKIQNIDIMNNEIFKSGRPFEDTSNEVVIDSDPERNLIHKYPEIIIDKISYGVSENEIEAKGETVHHTTLKHLTNEEKTEVAAKTLDTLMKIIMKGSHLRRNEDISKEKDLDDIQRSTHIHNAYHNHVINNMPLPYTGLLPRGRMSLGKLPEDYRQLHRIITRPRSAFLEPNLQLNRWSGNTGQSPLMSISRPYNHNHVHFIPKSLNLLPRIVYGPLFHRK